MLWNMLPLSGCMPCFAFLALSYNDVLIRCYVSSPTLTASSGLWSCPCSMSTWQRHCNLDTGFGCKAGTSWSTLIFKRRLVLASGIVSWLFILEVMRVNILDLESVLFIC